MIITGCKAPGSQTTNKEDNKNAIAQVLQKVGINKDHIKNNVNNIRPVSAPNNRPSKKTSEKQARISKFPTHNCKEQIFINHKKTT